MDFKIYLACIVDQSDILNSQCSRLSPLIHEIKGQAQIVTVFLSLFQREDSLQTTLGLLRKKEGIRKAEVVEACQAEGLDISEAQYSKLLKELCQSRGALWFLKESNKA